MPATRMSTTFLLIMDFNNGAAWDDAEVCHRLGFRVRPSAEGPAPTGLTAADSAHIATFLDSLANRAPDARVKWIEHGEDCQAGRVAFNRWFRKTIAPRFNKLIEELWSEASCHPSQIIRMDVRAEWPASLKCHRALDDVAEGVFGEALLETSGLHQDAHQLLLSACNLNWERLRKQYIRAGINMAKVKAKAAGLVHGE